MVNAHEKNSPGIGGQARKTSEQRRGCIPSSADGPLAAMSDIDLLIGQYRIDEGLLYIQDAYIYINLLHLMHSVMHI